MQWFATTPFNVLILLFCTSLVTVTLRRIPFRVLNYGVWMIHTGIIILCIGSVIYFGQKVEGDSAVYRRMAKITVPGLSEPVEMVCRPGSEMQFEAGGHRYSVSLPFQGGVTADFPLMTPGYEGKKAYAYTFNIASSKRGEDGQFSQFQRMVLVGYPELTNDILSTGQRAKAATGEALVDPELKIELVLAPSTHFYVRDSSALYIRPSAGGDDEEAWREFPIEGLPRYSEHVADLDEMVEWADEGGKAYQRSALDLAIIKKGDFSGEGQGGDVEARIVAFLPYAELTEKWTDGGDRLNPVMGFTISSHQEQTRRELMALDPRKNRIPMQEAQFEMAFSWINDASMWDDLTRDLKSRFVISVPGKNVKKEIEFSAFRDGGEIAIEGTDYKVELLNATPSFVMVAEPYNGQNSAMAMVAIRSPEARITRSVVAKWPEASQDFNDKMERQGKMIDENISIEWVDASPQGLFFVAGPAPMGLRAYLRMMDGRLTTYKDLTTGSEVRLAGSDVPLRIDYYHERAKRFGENNTLARIVPRMRRESMQQVGMHKSMVQVEVRRGDKKERRWLEYGAYAHNSRGGYFPQRFDLGDGVSIDLLYTRERELLPAPVVLEEFILETYPGGERERDYISHVRFQNEDGSWGDLQEVKSNTPSEHGGYWFFQSTWDPPDRRFQYGGMSHTGLGVGNREGVYIQLLGCIIAVVGMIYAFYIKPIIRRRRQDAVYRQVAAGAFKKASSDKADHPSKSGSITEQQPEPAQV
jgi:hypothetical protein